MNPQSTGNKGAKVSDFMHREMKTIASDASLREAGQAMSDNRVGALLVVRGNEYVGIISEKRLTREGMAKGLNPETTQVQAIMRPEPIAIDGESSVKEAQAMMKNRGVRHLVVTQNGQIVGIVSVSDLIRFYSDFFDESQ
ncbi:MAG: CBS domain-containing protein [Nitrospirales bacterium]|nr:CBS domain-containing protein [Nitrospirales bacterium]